MHYFLGLDVAKDSFVAALLDESREPAKVAAFANTTDGFCDLLAWLTDPLQTIALLEPTGVYGQRLKQALASAVASLHEINAQTLRRYSFSQVRTKTDEADALAIADAVRTLFLSKPEVLQTAAFRAVRSGKTWPCGWASTIDCGSPSPLCGSRSRFWIITWRPMPRSCSGAASRNCGGCSPSKRMYSPRSYKSTRLSTTPRPD